MNKTFHSFLGVITLTFALHSGFAVAGDCGKIPAWLKVTETKFRVVEPTKVFDVKVNFPEVSDLECSASPFEYGTDYYFTLKKSEPVKVSYFEKGGDEVKRSVEMTDFLNAHSVFVAVEREKTPHYLEVTDDELDVTWYIYLSEKDGPAYARKKGADQKYKIIK